MDICLGTLCHSSFGSAAALSGLARFKNPSSSSAFTNMENDGGVDSDPISTAVRPVPPLDHMPLPLVACGDSLPAAALLELKERINISL
jgi:hypothetical protein